MASKKNTTAKPTKGKPATIGDLTEVIGRLLPTGNDDERARANLVQVIASCMVLDVLTGPTARLDGWLAETRRRQAESQLGGTDGLYSRAVDNLLQASRGQSDLAQLAGHRVFATKAADETARAIELAARRLARAQDGRRGVYPAVARLALRSGFDQRKTGESETAAINRIAKKVKSADDRHRKRLKAT